MPSGFAAEKLGPVAAKLAVALAKLAASLLVLRAGFSAVSDDDYARIVIAQRFAEAPALDPSGTSWLPLPFWVYGGALAACADDLRGARVVAIGLGICAALLVWLAARWLGANRAGSLCAGLLAALFPWSVWLGAAPLPEAPAAALVVLGMAGLASDVPLRRLSGGAALAAACFCRYEAWPVALAFAAITARDVGRAPGTPAARTRLAGALLALAPIAAWLAHGAVRHGEALFFWKRVAGYRDALGGGPPLFERVASLPLALVGEEPGLLLLLLVTLVPVWRAVWPRYRRPLAAALALLAFLAAGELGGGGPTHHSSRALLALWYLAAAAAGDALGSRLTAARGISALGWLAAPLAALALSWWAPGAVRRDFPDRSSALDIGARARELGAPRLLIDTPDYSYLAVTAAFGRPQAAVPLDDHDPRKPRKSAALAAETPLRAALAEAPEAWLVASRAHAAVATRIGRVRAGNTDYVLVEPSR